MKRHVLCTLLICWISLVMAIPSATAASFDLLLKGHWAYADLMLLADAHLLVGYDNGQELAAVFPLTRYEVALLVEEILVERDQWDEQNDISADTLMWEILEGSTRNGKVSLSTEVVAQARRDSEGAYKALARLTQEFGNELDALGIAINGGLLSLTGKAKKGGSRAVTMAGVSVDSSVLQTTTLVRLGAAQLVGLVSSSAATNGYTLSGGLGVEVRPIRVNVWQSHNTSVQPLQEVKSDDIATSPSLAEDEGENDTYAPVDVMALVEYSIERPNQALPAFGDDQTESEEGSLRLHPNMLDTRPMGLLTSYFLGRTAN